MASEKKGGSWMGHPLLDKEHEHELHLSAALNEFQGGMPRGDAEKRALEDYRREHHARAAAHHYAGMKAGHATGNMDDAKKHHALYSLHVKALGEDPMGPVPESVRKFHGGAGTDKKQRPVYSFRGHDADQFLVQPVTKSELEVIDLKKTEPTAAAQAEVLRAAVNKAIAGISLDNVSGELVDYLSESLPAVAPTLTPVVEPVVVAKSETDPVKRAAAELGRTLEVLSLAKSILARMK